MTKININISEGFLQKLDEGSREANMNRSEFIREAVLNFISYRQEEKRKQSRRKKIEDAISFFELMGKRNKYWDGTKEINRFRQSRKISE